MRFDGDDIVIGKPGDHLTLDRGFFGFSPVQHPRLYVVVELGFQRALRGG